jgi:Domain of unknown function DUF29
MRSSARESLPALYDDDFHAWSLAQATVLRKLRPAGIDWANLAEEVEALAKTDRRTLKSCSRTLLAHLLKLKYWRSERATNERLWRSSIRNARQEILDILADSPSLKAFLQREYAECYRVAAAEVADLAGVSMPQTPPWTLDVVLAEDFFAHSSGGPDHGSG